MRDPEEKDDQETIGSDRASLREAAEQRGPASDPPVKRRYLNRDGKRAAGNEAISLDRAARDYASATAAEKLAADNESAKTLAEHVDALRGEAASDDPDAADFYGFKPSEEGEAKSGRASEAEQHRSKDVVGDGSNADLDPELAKAMRHPQVLHAIEQQVGEAERARQSYRDGLAAATQIAQVLFVLGGHAVLITTRLRRCALRASQHSIRGGSPALVILRQ